MDTETFKRFIELATLDEMSKFDHFINEATLNAAQCNDQICAECLIAAEDVIRSVLQRDCEDEYTINDLDDIALTSGGLFL